MEKFQYTVGYVDFKHTYQSFIVYAADWEELLQKIYERMPEDADYISNVTINKWATEHWEE